jgi:hypothetical protein
MTIHTEYDEIRPVANVAEMEEVYRLTHDSYVSKAYAENQSNGLLLHYPEYDVIPETTVLIALQDGKMIGTISVTLPGPFGYTLDRDFREEIAQLRNEGRQVGVIWRLVVKEECRSSRAVLLGLISAVTRHFLNHGLDTYLFEVNPRHERIYQRLLNMTVMSRKESAEGLQHAPAVLLRGNCENLPAEWRLSGYIPKNYDPVGLPMLDQILSPLPNKKTGS